MLIAKKYNDSTRIEECFYDSSNVYYSACYDKIDDFKQLTIVFKNGQQYVYNDIDVTDYLMFRDSQSQGKALNAFITIKPNGKAKYTYKRLTPVNLDEYKEKLEVWLEENKTTVTTEETPVIPSSDNVIMEISTKSFLIKVGDTVISGFDPQILPNMTLLLDTLKINYSKHFLK